MIDENEITEGCNVLYKDKLFSVKWKQTNKVIIRPVDDIGFIETGYDMISPILITPEILQNIGFSQTSDNGYTFNDKEGKEYELEFEGTLQTVLRINGENTGKPDLTLHQLQKEIYKTSNVVCCLKNVEPDDEPSS